ncbi:hypothetical protein MTQ01_03280 [Streptomyces sp. XM4193]|uniref:hypothetical protein n=1 Tax=Streptomyces sp. XM4193 TaxID=2929782 RepID=UPI001FF83F43|nr:hypothetical protein [Streptomyces sp. XM4193]MCK1795048.1 hypothetical protein [Streptomyces sp. XM4193]
MSEDRHERPAGGRPEEPDERTPGTSWAVGGADSGRAGSGPSGSDGADAYRRSSEEPPAGSDPGDAQAEGEALRRMLHGAAEGLEPRPGALEEIRHAIPVRRARRRNAMVGAGAAALVVGVTLPLMQAGVVPGPLNGDSQSNAAHSGPGEKSDPYEDGASVGGGLGGADQESADGSGASGGSTGKPSGDPSAEDSASPSGDGGPTVGVPGCGPDQLGNGDVTVGDPDSRGRVYGSFELTNVSDQTCRVKGRDGLKASGVGSAPSSDLQVLDHTPGGRATELPDPSDQNGPVVLRPGEAYQVKFAWIPSPARGQTCTPRGEEPDPTDPPPGGPGGGTEDPGDGGDSGDGGSDGGDSAVGGGGDGGDATPSGPEPQSGGTDGGDADNSAVLLNYTPAAGEPSLPTVHFDVACTGKVYRTAPLQTS